MLQLIDQLRELRPCVPTGIAASALGISERRVTQLISSGKLQCEILGSSRFILVSSILRRHRLLREMRLLPVSGSSGFGK